MDDSNSQLKLLQTRRIRDVPVSKKYKKFFHRLDKAFLILVAYDAIVTATKFAEIPTKIQQPMRIALQASQVISYNNMPSCVYFAGDSEHTVCGGNTDNIHNLCISSAVETFLQVEILYVSGCDSTGRDGGFPPSQRPVPPTISC